MHLQNQDKKEGKRNCKIMHAKASIHGTQLINLDILRSIVVPKMFLSIAVHQKSLFSSLEEKPW